MAAAQSNDGGPVGVAKNDLRAHVNQLVDEEEAAFKHFLVDEHTALGLSGHHQYDAHQVRSKTRPGGIVNGHDGTVDEGLYFVFFLPGNENIIPFEFHLNSHAFEDPWNDAKFFYHSIFDGDLRLGHCCQADETAHFDHIGQQSVFGASQLFDAFNNEQVRADAGDVRTHAVEHAAQLLDIGLAGGVIDLGSAFRQNGRHHYIGCSGNRDFIHQDVGALQMRRCYVVLAMVATNGKSGSEHFQPQEMGVEAAAADLVSTRFGQDRPAEAGQQGCDEHDRAADAPGQAVRLVTAPGSKATPMLGPAEVDARLRLSVTRMEPADVADSPIRAGDLTIDEASYTVRLRGHSLDLTYKEFELLKYLWQHQGQTVSREELLNEVWGYEEFPTTRTVDNFILKLRKRIESDPARPRFILTVHGIGYKLVP